MPVADALAIRVVWGVGAGPTDTAAYDAALAEAGVGDYNLRPVSSIIPAGVPVEVPGSAPGLGPVGAALTVVEARCVAPGPGRVTAGIGWSREPDGPGVFYEAAGETGEPEIERRIRDGLSAGRDLREWGFEGEDVRTTSAGVEDGRYGAAVVLAAYGHADPIV